MLSLDCGGCIMKIDILQKNYIVRERLAELIEKKVKKLEKYFNKESSCKVVCSANKDKTRFKMEITMASAGKYIRSEVETDNMYANLDICLARIEKQLVKMSGKLVNKMKKSTALKNLAGEMLPEFEFLDELPVFNKPQIVRNKVYDLVAITPEQAIEEMELIGNSFYIFKNKNTGAVNVVYQRREGGYGLIETR